MKLRIESVSFTEILPIWKNSLWPGRESAVKSHSSMVYLGGTDMSIYKNPASYWSVYGDKNEVIAVNSGFRTATDHYRSRGVFVAEEFRGKGIAKMLLLKAVEQAGLENCSIIWSFPRERILSVYQSVGFKSVEVKDPLVGEFGPNLYVARDV